VISNRTNKQTVSRQALNKIRHPISTTIIDLPKCLFSADGNDTINILSYQPTPYETQTFHPETPTQAVQLRCRPLADAHRVSHVVACFCALLTTDRCRKRCQKAAVCVSSRRIKTTSHDACFCSRHGHRLPLRSKNFTSDGNRPERAGMVRQHRPAGRAEPSRAGSSRVERAARHGRRVLVVYSENHSVQGKNAFIPLDDDAALCCGRRNLWLVI